MIEVQALEENAAKAVEQKRDEEIVSEVRLLFVSYPYPHGYQKRNAAANQNR